MQPLRLLATSMVLFLIGGCATMEKNEPHVLSGMAPVEDVIEKGDEIFRAGDFEAAAILYQIATRQQPTDESWFKLGLTYSRLSRQEQALGAFSQALELNPEHVGALEKMGLFYTSKGDATRARKYLQKLVGIDQESWKGLNSLGVLEDLDGNFTRARQYYTDALKIRPDLPMLWNNLGYSIYLMGDLEDAITYISRALELDPGYNAARQNLALIYVRQEDFERALGVFDRTAGIAKAYANVGYLAYKVGEYDKAEELLEEAIRQSPTYNKAAHTYLAAAREANGEG